MVLKIYATKLKLHQINPTSPKRGRVRGNRGNSRHTGCYMKQGISILCRNRPTYSCVVLPGSWDFVLHSLRLSGAWKQKRWGQEEPSSSRVLRLYFQHVTNEITRPEIACRILPDKCDSALCPYCIWSGFVLLLCRFRRMIMHCLGIRLPGMRWGTQTHI